jgi:hypothetical protein
MATLTKKMLKKWVNVAGLLLTLVGIIGVSVLQVVPTTGGKLALIGVIVAAVLSRLPTIRSEAEKAIEASGLPDGEK